ncbi:ribokinase [Diaporthe helianthi]|uniref:Ribokinase n=1 Tax=Diaporthe helianthi TaxID=158607 RepID=A0A2P5I1H8_DIAHE|nr:ribokinase [Diaporthe helianthi]
MAGSNSDLPRICVLGSLNIDLVSYVPHHPAPGETLTSNSFQVSPGGKGANQAVACAKLSRPRPEGGRQADDDAQAAARVSMVGSVGADTYGSMLLDSLRSHGVDVSGVTAPGELKTGIAIIIVDEPTGQNRIVLSAEANHDGMAAADFETSIAPRVGRPDLLVMQLEVPLPTVLLALARARGQGVPVLLNPAPAVELPAEVYSGLAHLVVNETEASILSGLPVGKLDTAGGCAEVAAWFLEKGVQTTIITLGGRGVYFKSAAAEGLLPAEKVREVVDTTAAGDTFVGQYALEVVGCRGKGRHFDLEAAVRKANKAGAITVQRKGAAASIPWRDEVA